MTLGSGIPGGSKKKSENTVPNLNLNIACRGNQASAFSLGIQSRPLLNNGGGVPVGLPQDQAAHPPTQADPPTHPPTQTPPTPSIGGLGFLCCNNQLVTQKPCVFTQKKLCHSVTMPSLSSAIAEVAVTLVVDRCTVELAQRWFKLHWLQTGKFCHFLPLFSQ